MISLVSASNKLNVRDIKIKDSQLKIKIWEQKLNQGAEETYYKLSNNGKSYGKIKKQRRLIKFSDYIFDPLKTVSKRGPNGISEHLISKGSNNLFIVQFITKPLSEYRKKIKALGGKIQRYLPHDSYIIHMQ